MTPWQKLDTLRDQFLSDGTLDEGYEKLVRAPVLRSWKRSRMLGSTDRGANLPFDSAAVSDSVLMQAADPILSTLADELLLEKSSLLIADRHTRILRTWTPDRQFRKRMEQIGSVAGHLGAESVIGTSGIGTPVEERQSQVVVGPEHISDNLTDFACFGSPIYNPISNRLLGVVTLTARVKDASPLLSGLINHAALSVGKQMLNLSSIRERILFDKFLETSKLSNDIAVVGGDILLATPGATENLQPIDPNVLWATISDGLSLKRPRRTFQFAIGEQSIRLLSTAVIFDEQIIGAIIEVLNSNLEQPVMSGVPDTTAPKWAPLAISLPGTSPAWVSTREQAEAAMKASIPVVVFGASGTGKTTLLKNMLDRTAPGHVPVIFNSYSALTESDEWLSALHEALNGSSPVIIKNLSHLNDELSRRVAHLIDENPSLVSQGRLHATSAAQGSHPVADGHQALLDVLAIGRIDIPNLRERKRDLRSLLHVFEKKYAASTTIRYSQGAFNALSRAPWPGNIRQLESVMRSVFALGRSPVVTTDRLPPAIAEYANKRELTMLEELEVGAIMNALIRCGGNKVLAADMLGISRSTLYRKLRTYKLDEEHFFL